MGEYMSGSSPVHHASLNIEDPPHESSDGPLCTFPSEKSGSHDTEVQISSEATDNEETVEQRRPDGREIDLDTAGTTADIDGDTSGSDDLVSDEEEAYEIVQYAISLLEEIKADLSLSNLDTAIFLFRQVLSDRPTTHPLHTDALRDLALALGVRFMYTSQADDFEESMHMYKKILQTFNLDRQASHTQKNTFVEDETDTDVGNTLELAKRMLTDIHQSTSLHVLNTVIFMIQHSLGHLTSMPALRMAALSALVDVLYARFAHQLDTSTNDLNEAITQSSIVYSLQEMQESSVNRQRRVMVLLFTRFQMTGDLIELQGALETTKAMNDATITTDLDKNFHIAEELLQNCMASSGDMNNLNFAVELWKEIMTKVQRRNDTYGNVINNLGITLLIRFQKGDEQCDLEEAISLHKQALDLRLPPHPGRFSSLNNLANALGTRFEQGGQENDLDEAISLYRQALDLLLPLHPNRSGSLNNIANALRIRFHKGGQQTDLDEAISLHRQALDLLLPPHPSRSSSLNNLANVLGTRFVEGGQQTDLDQAISLHRQALDLLLALHPTRSSSLNDLANALGTRFKQGGQQSDLDEAISLHRQALDLRLPPHPDRTISLNNLANALSRRFEQGSQQTDLDEIISLHRQALDLLFPLHPNRSNSLNNLANALHTRFEQAGQQTNLDEAISLHRQALDLRLPLHPDRSSSLNNLAIALRTRFEQRSQQTDLDEAVSLHRQALDLLLPPHPSRSSSLNNLANVLGTRFVEGGQQTDLDQAISLHRQALDLRPPPHPDRSISLNNLALALDQGFQRSGEQVYFDEAMSVFSAASQYPFQAPSHRLKVVKRWIYHVERTPHTSAAHAYEAGLQALHRVAFLSLDLRSRHLALTAGSDGLARDAARCAIRSGTIEKAIEFLEAGRSVFWSQVLSLRSPFDQLRNIAPDGHQLADRLQYIANALELGSHRDVSAQLFDNRKRLSIDQEASSLNRLNEEWDSIIHKVRQLSGFEDFLLPPRLSSLKAAVSDIPVIILVANDDASHCLIMTSTTIHHIPVPNLRIPILQILVDSIRIAAGQSLISRSFIHETQAKITTLLGEHRGISFQNDSESSDGIFRFVLGMLWEELVKPVIVLLDIKKSDVVPDLRWCPTGLFTFLPIHAAGCYDNDLAIDCAPDYFISSYTPTISALLSVPLEPSTQTFKMMAVIPSSELPSTRVELNKIQQYVPAHALISFGVPRSPAVVEDVASRLSTVSIVHFACHGMQDQLKPLDSGLKLDDGLLHISRIMKEKMPNGSLAFLCACETAMGDAKLPDESMSIAASLIFSGFQRVVATMWAIRDEDGPTIADVFYRELFRGPNGEKALVPDVTKSARALHTAVQELRSQNVPFRRWVPFIHMGK